MTAFTALFAFQAVWYGCGRSIANLDKVAELAHALDAQGVPHDARVLWATQRPDARLSFYFDRTSRQMISAGEIVQRFVDRTTHGQDIELMVLERAESLLAEGEPVYLILDREDYSKARMLGLDEKVYLIAEANDPAGADNDWVVISNKRPRAAGSAPS
jgi:hypothetical protein